jgi:hypothetical protein
MRLRKLASIAFAFSVAGIGPALAQVSAPTVAPRVSDSQKSTAVDSGNQSQANATATFTLPAIGSVIQQSLQGRGLAGQRAAVELGPMHRGMAAGDDAWGWQAWAQGGGGRSTNSLATGGYDLANYGSQVGIQAQITPKFLVGFSGSWQGSDGSLNGGFSSSNSTFGITSYAGWQFDEKWNASAIVGYSTGSTSLTNSGLAYGANYQSSQWNFQGGLNGYYKVGAVVLAPMVALLYSPINSFGYVDSAAVAVPGKTTALTRGSTGGFISLPLTGWQPYLRATIEHDFSMVTGSEANGDTGGTAGLGATIPFTDAIWASLDGGYNSIGRTGLSLWSASARINLRF